jgi:hypothetical protein
MAGFVGFGDAAFPHTPLTRVRPNWGALRGQWNREICLCTLDPFVRYYAYYQGKSQTATQVMDLVDGQAKPGHESFHPLETGDSHYGTEGQAELSFRCCEPHCNAGLETSRPEMPNVAFTNWMNTYQHGNGVLWGLQVAAQEYEDNGMGGSHKILIVLGDGADFCPGGTLNAMMPPPCSTGGNLTAETIAYAQTLWEDQRIHIYPVYYGTNGWTRDYYEDLATGEGRMFNPTTPAELEAVFSEIVYRSQIVLVP